MKIGIFGGSFNPPHNGHVNSLVTVQKKMGFDKIHIIPNNQNPLKIPTELPNAEHRIEMSKQAFATYGPAFFIDDIEIKRGGKSYTIDTVLELRKQYDAKDLYLIIGADNFETFSEWKDWKKILSEINLVVTTRPGYEIPEAESDFPDYLTSLIGESDFGAVELTTGRSIEFITLDDLNISSSELRKKLRVGRATEKFLPLSVESYIKKHKIYRASNEKITDYAKFTQYCAQVLFDKKAIAVRAFDLQALGATTDFTLIASGTSTRHTASMAENLVMAIKEEFNLLPQGVEGVDEGRWVVVDYGALIVHLFYDFVRQEYRLEELWKTGVEIPVKDTKI
ncbi:MAG: nicotinate (nicotinamide) nucleotide adenylyltransferase [Bdellovibrionaceae bacterium]|nr:nicotinate (nicotinamide) nucleotide adenylyltransferase [Pseudobdellovibrionaceae bacterium]